MFWRYVLRPLLFSLPAEWVHHRSMGLYHWLVRSNIARPLTTRFGPPSDARLAVDVAGIHFRNCLGLAAGFDKNAVWFNDLALLGFGHVEIGTITHQPQSGNPKPRLFRLARDRALINRMGFNNPGAEAVAQRLRKSPKQVVLGINIGKSRVVAVDEAVDDYCRSLRLLFPFADYLAVNVSSPNTPNLRQLQERGPLLELLTQLRHLERELSQSHQRSPMPIFVKIAPDLSEGALEDVLEIALQVGVDGIIATNTTIDRTGLRTSRRRVERIGSGGLSGAPLTARARAVVAFISQRVGQRLEIVGSGGIMSGEDAWRMIGAGASLVQLYTGFVYGGPRFVAQVASYLGRRLDESGLASIAAARGRDLD
jgi:dihydroorotate dehydrogenase